MVQKLEDIINISYKVGGYKKNQINWEPTYFGNGSKVMCIKHEFDGFVGVGHIFPCFYTEIKLA